MNWLKNTIFNCKKATFLIEKEINSSSLDIKEQGQLKIHLIGCSFCRLYKKQSIILQNFIGLFYKDIEANSYKLDEDYKRQLQSHLNEEINKK